MDVRGLHLVRVLGGAGGVECAGAVVRLLRGVLVFVVVLLLLGWRGVVLLLLLGWGCDVVVVVIYGSVVGGFGGIFVLLGLVVFVAFVGGVGDHFCEMEVVGLWGSVGDVV